MTEPEEIYLEIEDGIVHWSFSNKDGYIKYIRADIHEEELQDNTTTLLNYILTK